MSDKCKHCKRCKDGCDYCACCGKCQRCGLPKLETVPAPTVNPPTFVPMPYPVQIPMTQPLQPFTSPHIIWPVGMEPMPEPVKIWCGTTCPSPEVLALALGSTGLPSEPPHGQRIDGTQYYA